MNTGNSLGGTLSRAMVALICLLFLVAVSAAQARLDRPGNTAPGTGSFAPAVQQELALHLVKRMRADHPESSPATLYDLLRKDLDTNGYYSSLAAGMNGSLYLTTNEKLALLFLAGVALGVLLA